MLSKWKKILKIKNYPEKLTNTISKNAFTNFIMKIRNNNNNMKTKRNRTNHYVDRFDDYLMEVNFKKNDDATESRTWIHRFLPAWHAVSVGIPLH